MNLTKRYRSFVLISFMFLNFVLLLKAQVYVNLQKDNILKRINQDFPGYVLDKSSVNKVYKYLKFADEANDATLLVFLGPDDKCTYTKQMLAFSNLQSEIELLNRKYKKAADMLWICRENDTDCIIKLIKEEWFFSVVIKKK